MTPEAGPDSSVAAVWVRAAATGMMPPFDFVTYGMAGAPRAVRACAKPSR